MRGGLRVRSGPAVPGSTMSARADDRQDFFSIDSDERRLQQALQAAQVVIDEVILSLEAPGLPSDEVMQAELAAIERKNELLRRRLNEAMVACEPAESLPTDLSAAQAEIIALRRGVRQLSDALLEGASLQRFAEKQFSNSPSRRAVGAGVPLPLSSKGGNGTRPGGDRAPSEAELALELEVQELTHRALSLELEELLRANMTRVTSIAEPEPEPEPQPMSQAATVPTAGAEISLAAEVARQGKCLDALVEEFADMRTQQQQGSSDTAEQDFTDWVSQYKKDVASAADRNAVQQQLKQARMKFNELDKHGDGVLGLDELEQLAEWVFEGFHPGGEKLSASQQHAEAAKLLQQLDLNGDGVLSFEEFAGWFTRTCASIHRCRQQPERVKFADDTKGAPSKKLVRQQTGLGESTPAFDGADPAPTGSDMRVAPLPPMLRMAKAAQKVRTSVSVINTLKHTAKGMGAMAHVKAVNDTDDHIQHVLPAVAVAAVEEVVEDLECRMENLKEDMKQVRAMLQAALEAAS